MTKRYRGPHISIYLPANMVIDPPTHALARFFLLPMASLLSQTKLLLFILYALSSGSSNSITSTIPSFPPPPQPSQLSAAHPRNSGDPTHSCPPIQRYSPTHICIPIHSCRPTKPYPPSHPSPPANPTLTKHPERSSKAPARNTVAKSCRTCPNTLLHL